MIDKFVRKVNFGKYSSSSLGSNLLNFYNFKFSEAMAFGLGEGLFFRLYKYHEEWKVENCNLNLVYDLGENLTFFINRFMAYSPAELFDRIKENLYVKKYPFLITFLVCKPKLDLAFGEYNVNADYSSDAEKLFQRIFVYAYDPEDESLVINDGIKHYAKIPSQDFLNLFSYEDIDVKTIVWEIYIPPRRIIRTSFIISHLLYRTSNRMLYLQGDSNNFYGVQGIEKTFDFIKSSNIKSDTSRRLIKSIVYDETKDGYYRDIFADFLVEAQNKLEAIDLHMLIKSYRRLALLWKELFVHLESDSVMEPGKTYVILMDEILKLEKYNLIKLEEIVCNNTSLKTIKC